MQCKPLAFHRPSMTSTHHATESIATLPPESDLNDEQIRTMLASPLYLQEREASADRSRVYHSLSENSLSSSSHFRESTGKPFALFSNRRKSSQEALSDRLFLRTPTGSRKQRTSIQILKPGKFGEIILLEEHTDNMLAEAKSEVRKQEYGADFSTVLFVIFRDNLFPIRLEIYCTTQGYEESRKEQARLREELAQRERVLRETQIRSIHEVEN